MIFPARFHDLVGRHLLYLLPALRAIWFSHARKKHSQIVVDLGDGRDRGARIGRMMFLVYGDGRREPFNFVHIRFVQAAQKLPGIGRKGFDIAALALGKDGVKRQRRFSRTGEAGENHHLVARDLEIDVLQIMFSRPTDYYFIFMHTAEWPLVRFTRGSHPNLDQEVA